MRKKILIMVMFIVLVTVTNVGYCDEKIKELTLENSSIDSGILNSQEGITLNFNKNIANFIVRDNNLTCFKLYDESQEVKQIEVAIADDQVDREKRRTVVIKLQDELDSNGVYTLVVDKRLASKSGVTLKNDIRIDFKLKTKGYGDWNVGLFIVLIIITLLYFFARRRRYEKEV